MKSVRPETSIVAQLSTEVGALCNDYGHKISNNDVGLNNGEDSQGAEVPEHRKRICRDVSHGEVIVWAVLCIEGKDGTAITGTASNSTATVNVNMFER